MRNSPLKAKEVSQEMIKADEAPIFVASSELAVMDLKKTSNWYQDIIGLELLSSSADLVTLGVDGKELLRLTQKSNLVKAAKNAPGLFHNAFLLPNRAGLAAWFVHATSKGEKLTGAADHLVSEALYLDDPEGNGIEVYADRASNLWDFDANGTVAIDNLPMDLEALYSAGTKLNWNGMPKGSILGHIHLKVSSFDQTTNLFEKILGFDLMAQMPAARFYATGRYHHHIGTNVWHSRGQPAREKNTTGLLSYTFKFNDRELYSNLIDQLGERDTPYQNVDDKIIVQDPWGMDVVFI